MNKLKLTHEEKIKDWIHKMDKYEKSGLTMHEWCELNGESYSTLRRWKKILSEKM